MRSSTDIAFLSMCKDALFLFSLQQWISRIKVHAWMLLSIVKWWVLNSWHLIIDGIFRHKAFFHLPRFNWRGASPIESFLGYPDDLRFVSFALEFGAYQTGYLRNEIVSADYWMGQFFSSWWCNNLPARCQRHWRKMRLFEEPLGTISHPWALQDHSHLVGVR